MIIRKTPLEITRAGNCWEKLLEDLEKPFHEQWLNSSNNVDALCKRVDKIETVNMQTHTFVRPVKAILVPEDIATKWDKSEAYHDLLGFICFINDAIKNKKLSDPCHVSKTVENLLEILNTMDKWVDEIPPIDQPQRFGNKAFRDWVTRLQENAESLLLAAVEEKFHPAVPEVSVYLVEGVGNPTRIDYGTGHELAFVAFLCCLFKVGICEEQDSVAIGCRVFTRYIEVMRKVQMTYRLEPAGSQGVWNLDDFQFIPFIWGSSQLLDHKRLKPKSFLDKEICESFSKDYMFLGCIQYIHKVKTGPFAEHSNQLWNISGVPAWSKVNTGLIKMFRVEVLSKFPIIQHFVFGSLLKISPAMN